MERKLKRLNKINFGCGWDKRTGWLNVDVDINCMPDLLIQGSDYSVIPKNHYKEILANDVLEHISHAQTSAVLLEWSEFLRKKGKLHLQTSSILGVAEQLKKQSKYADQVGWTICLFGNQQHPGDFHHIGFTEATLKTNLIAAGFEIDSFELQDNWLFHVECHKVSDWTSVVKKNNKKNTRDFLTEIFKAALGRVPDFGGLAETHLEQELEAKKITRKEAAKHLFQSRERLYYIATENNL